MAITSLVLELLGHFDFIPPGEPSKLGGWTPYKGFTFFFELLAPGKM